MFTAHEALCREDMGIQLWRRDLREVPASFKLFWQVRVLDSGTFERGVSGAVGWRGWALWETQIPAELFAFSDPILLFMQPIKEPCAQPCASCSSDHRSST